MIFFLRLLYAKIRSNFRRCSKTKWLFSAILVLYVVCFLNKNECRIYRLPGYHSNREKGRTNSTMIPEVTLSDREMGMSRNDIENFVLSGNTLDDFEFVLNSKVCPEKEVHLLAVVHSKPSNFLKRQAVRDTWGAIFQHKAELELIFLLGLADNVTNVRVAKEGETNLDIVQASFEDTYDHLILKSVAMLQWNRQFCQHAKHLLKIDDDVFLQSSSLMSKLNLLRNEKKFIMGYTGIGLRPFRSIREKWYIPYGTYRFDIFPPYVLGFSYVISADLVDGLYNAARHKSRIGFEDIFVTGMCAHIAGASLVGRCGFHSYELIPPTRFTWFVSDSVIACHDYSPDEMRELWESLESWKDWLPFFRSLWKKLCFILPL